jgi:hypothetical protein
MSHPHLFPKIGNKSLIPQPFSKGKGSRLPKICGYQPYVNLECQKVNLIILLLPTPLSEGDGGRLSSLWEGVGGGSYE